MKAFLFALAMPLAFAGETESIPDCHMSGIPRGDPRFATAFAAASGTLGEQTPNNDPVATPIKILQTIEAGKYLAVLASGAPDPFVVIIPDSKLADGDTGKVYMADTGKLHEYESVLGAKKTVRIYQKYVPEMHPAKGMTEDQFIERMKQGEDFVAVLSTKLVKCENCSGKGTAGAANARCQKCSGKGKISVPQRYRIKW